MSDTSLKIAFDYKWPDIATLIIYKVWSTGFGLYAEPSISIIKTYTGNEAIDIYKKLSGKTDEEIFKEGGMPMEDKENG